MLIGLEFFALSWPEIDQINGSFPFSCLINFPVLLITFSGSGFTRVHLYSLFIFIFFYVLVKGLVGIELP